MRINFSIPLVPPSVNHYKMPRNGGGWYVGEQAKAFIDAVCMLRPVGMLQAEFYEVQIVYSIIAKNFRRSDLDNLLKVSLDSLTKAELITDDRRVMTLNCAKRPVQTREEESTEFTVIEL